MVGLLVVICCIAVTQGRGAMTHLQEHSLCRHLTIVWQLVGGMQPASGKIMLVTEFMESGDLWNAIITFRKSGALSWYKRCAIAVRCWPFSHQNYPWLVGSYLGALGTSYNTANKVLQSCMPIETKTFRHVC